MQMTHMAPNGAGEFEGEPCYARELWQEALAGADDESFWNGDIEVSVFKIDMQLVRKWPCCLSALQIGEFIVLWEDGNGFVNVAEVTDQGLSEMMTDCGVEP